MSTKNGHTWRGWSSRWRPGRHAAACRSPGVPVGRRHGGVWLRAQEGGSGLQPGDGMQTWTGAGPEDGPAAIRAVTTVAVVTVHGTAPSGENPTPRGGTPSPALGPTPW